MTLTKSFQRSKVLDLRNSYRTQSESQSNLALHACRIKHSHPTPCHSPAGSGSPLGCSLVVTGAKALPTYTHKPSTEYCIMSPQDRMARAPLKAESGSHESSKLTGEVMFALNLFCIISICANYDNQQQQSLWWEG